MASKSHYETNDGNGSETHQRIRAKAPHDVGYLTTNQGIRVSDNQNSLKSGTRGPALLEDFVLREKIFHFDHERELAERIVHARGTAAHGYFELYESLTGITKADLFQRPGAKVSISPALPPSRAALARSIRRAPAICAASRSNSIRRRAIGIW